MHEGHSSRSQMAVCIKFKPIRERIPYSRKRVCRRLNDDAPGRGFRAVID